MTSARPCALMRVPRRWDAVAGIVSQVGAGVAWSGAHGWLVDRPSKRWQGARDTAKSDLRYPAAGWWIGLSKRQAAVGDDRAGRSLRPTRYRSKANGREPGRPDHP